MPDSVKMPYFVGAALIEKDEDIAYQVSLSPSELLGLMLVKHQAFSSESGDAGNNAVLKNGRINLSASGYERYVELRWSAQGEFDSAKVEISRSQDGINFETLTLNQLMLCEKSKKRNRLDPSKGTWTFAPGFPVLRSSSARGSIRSRLMKSTGVQNVEGPHAMS